MINNEVLEVTEQYVKNELGGEGSGHDWWHIHRVRNTALQIGKEEQADLFIVELAALLHDIADHKFHEGDEEIGPKTARIWLEQFDLVHETIEHVCDIIKNISYKGAEVATPMTTIEGKVVQDADRLDAMGAIGIARAFAYGGYKNRLLYDPTQKPVTHQSFDAYKNSKGPTINHFYEKLLLLKDRMNTHTGKELAKERHLYMLSYLKQFYAEWDGKK